jgi:hypothetical protein
MINSDRSRGTKELSRITHTLTMFNASVSPLKTLSGTHDMNPGQRPKRER